MKKCMFCLFCSCNFNAKPPNTIKVVLVGGDWLQGAVLRHYVDLLGVRPPDWIQHIRFFIVPIGKFYFLFPQSNIINTHLFKVHVPLLDT